MKKHLIGGATPVSALGFILCLFLFAACGANSNGSAPTTSTTSATATACAQNTRTALNGRSTIGTVKSINGQTLVVTTMQGQQVNVTYTSNTTFTQQVKLTPADLKEGSTVRVTVNGTGGTYTAVAVTVSDLSNGNGSGLFGNPGGGRGRPRGTPGTGNPCFSQFQRNGTPGAGNGFFGSGNGSNGGGNGTNTTGLNGKISQVNGDILTVADTSGGTFQVTLNNQTQITETKSASAADLKVGEPVVATGRPGSQGTVTANSIVILLALPTGIGPRATATP